MKESEVRQKYVEKKESDKEINRTKLKKEEQKKMKIKDKKENIEEKRMKLNIYSAPCTLRSALIQIPVFTTFCV